VVLTKGSGIAAAELNYARLQQSFADKAHDTYLIYDEIMDQLIVRLVDPSLFVSEYFVSDDFALLVTEDRNVVGYLIVNFRSEYLAKEPKLNALWNENNLASHLDEYRKLRYEPDAQKTPQTIKRAEQRIVEYAAFNVRQIATLAWA